MIVAKIDLEKPSSISYSSHSSSSSLMAKSDKYASPLDDEKAFSVENVLYLLVS